MEGPRLHAAQRRKMGRQPQSVACFILDAPGDVLPNSVNLKENSRAAGNRIRPKAAAPAGGSGSVRCGPQRSAAREHAIAVYG